MRPSGDVRDDDDGCDGARGDAPADRVGNRPPEAGRSYSCPPTQSTVSSSHSTAPKLNKSHRDIRPRENISDPIRPSFSLNKRPWDTSEVAKIRSSREGDRWESRNNDLLTWNLSERDD